MAQPETSTLSPIHRAVDASIQPTGPVATARYQPILDTSVTRSVTDGDERRDWPAIATARFCYDHHGRSANSTLTACQCLGSWGKYQSYCRSFRAYEARTPPRRNGHADSTSGRSAVIASRNGPGAASRKRSGSSTRGDSPWNANAAAGPTGFASSKPDTRGPGNQADITANLAVGDDCTEFRCHWSGCSDRTRHSPQSTSKRLNNGATGTVGNHAREPEPNRHAR